MVKFFQQTTTFNYSWDQVAQGFWRRYPNPNSKHVLTEDTVERRITPDGQLVTKRLLSKTNSIPKWAERFVQKALVNIIEESIVDPKTKTLTTYTRNLGYTKVLSVTEKVVYKESSENPGKTMVLRTAVFDSQVSGFSRAICAFGYERFKKNCSKMVSGFEYVLAGMFPNSAPVITTTTVTAKLKDAAKNASELAKAKAAAAKVPLYVKLH
ncbi:protein preli-like [Coccinella septempunctata]|uniref:protein preli-like n=1 Tax=Coccinella septempunctata TaxID=41139 RepID=UPI001D072F09|nr:protein preli-like [Coccinella septempunctata]